MMLLSRVCVSVCVLCMYVLYFHGFAFVVVVIAIQYYYRNRMMLHIVMLEIYSIHIFFSRFSIMSRKMTA